MLVRLNLEVPTILIFTVSHLFMPSLAPLEAVTKPGPTNRLKRDAQENWNLGCIAAAMVSTRAQAGASFSLNH
jgi:hypothetical protein